MKWKVKTRKNQMEKKLEIIKWKIETRNNEMESKNQK